MYQKKTKLRIWAWLLLLAFALPFLPTPAFAQKPNPPEDSARDGTYDGAFPPAGGLNNPAAILREMKRDIHAQATYNGVHQDMVTAHIEIIDSALAKNDKFEMFHWASEISREYDGGCWKLWLIRKHEVPAPKKKKLSDTPWTPSERYRRENPIINKYWPNNR